MYKQDLALNNQQRLIYHKTQPTNIDQYYCMYMFMWIMNTVLQYIVQCLKL